MENGSIPELFHRVNKELVKAVRDLVEPLDFNRGELPFLKELIEKGEGITQKALAEDLPISKSTTSKMINNLVKKGYLKKETDPDDKRATKIYLTAKKREIEKKIGEIDKKTEKKMLKNFNQKEKQEINRYLQRILQNLEKED